jgi:hypothetical protein
MPRFQRKMCGAAPCGPAPFFQRAPQGALQRQDNDAQEEKKDPVAEGLKTTAEKLAEHEPLKQWYTPKLAGLKYTLWDRASTADKAAMLTFLGLNVGTAAAAFALDPKMRQSLSGVNIGKPLGWIPYSPVEGLRYTLPARDRGAYGFSADFTLAPYLQALRKKHPGLPLTGATFGLDTAYDPAGRGLSVTGGKFGLDFFGGGLKAEGKSAGSQFTVNADLLKLFPGLKRAF